MVQAHVPSVDSVICHEVTGLVSCTFDELAQRLPAYSWAQVFSAVDRLSRQGTLTISRTRCFGYVVSIGPSPPTPQSSQDRKMPGAVRSAQLIPSFAERKAFTCVGRKNDVVCEQER